MRVPLPVLLVPIAALVAVCLVACRRAAPPGSDEARRQRIAAMFREYRKSFPELPLIGAREAELQARQGMAVLLDVREPAEREVSILPGAVSREDFEAARDRYQGLTLVAYCTIGYRSGLYAAGLRRQGLDAWNLEGGILAWTHAGLPLQDRNGPTRRVHVHGERWQLAAKGYDAEW